MGTKQTPLALLVARGSMWAAASVCFYKHEGQTTQSRHKWGEKLQREFGGFVWRQEIPVFQLRVSFPLRWPDLCQTPCCGEGRPKCTRDQKENMKIIKSPQFTYNPVSREKWSRRKKCEQEGGVCGFQTACLALSMWQHRSSSWKHSSHSSNETSLPG